MGGIKLSDIDELKMLLNNGYFINNIQGIYYVGCKIDLCLSSSGTLLDKYGEKTSIFTYSECLFDYAYKVYKEQS